jgi:hypothetical protein
MTSVQLIGPESNGSIKVNQLASLSELVIQPIAALNRSPLMESHKLVLINRSTSQTLTQTTM